LLPAGNIQVFARARRALEAGPAITTRKVPRVVKDHTTIAIEPATAVTAWPRAGISQLTRTVVITLYRWIVTAAARCDDCDTT
jgi:hypothetical protein